MSKKERTTDGLTRAEIVTELRALADDLAQGRMRLGTRQVKVGETVSVKMKQKFTREMAYFTLAVKMELASGGSAITAQQLYPVEAGGETPEAPLVQGELGYSGKRLKKELGRLWKSVAKLIEARTMPDAAEIEGLLSRCEEYTLFAHEDWQADWTTCTTIIKKCLTDAAIGDWPAAKAMVTEIDRMMHDCHDRYK
jgi:XXXCH domain-containing protein